MKIITGLGNPGPKYETTRHNAGFLALDRMIDAWRCGAPQQVNGGEVRQASIGGERVLLVKPQTYMNNSGTCIGPLMRFYKCTPADLIVIHDDVDLPSLALRLKTGGGTGGHNGLKSIDAHLGAGSTGYHRIRIGVGRPPQGSPIQTADYVLQPFSDDELRRLDPLLDKITDAAERILRGDIKGAMNEYNVRGEE